MRVFTLSDIETSPLTDDELLSILKDEEADASSYYTSELADDQAKAMDRYHARPFGDEIEGRSKVVTHDIEDTINWIMPKLMRAFMQADELVSVEDPSSDDQQQPKCVGDYLRHIFFKDNDGETIIHDFAFDALLQKIGTIRTGWADPMPKPPKVLEGLGPEQLQKYAADPTYEILEQDTDGETFSLKVRQTPAIGRVVVENLPPEEYAFSRRARGSKQADYKRWKREMFLGDIIAQFPDKKMALEGGRLDDGDDAKTDGRANARFPGETDGYTRGNTDRKGRRKVWLIEEDIRVDFDGDGITELRHIKRVGDIILENVEIERSEYTSWTAIRVAHRLAGRSLADTIMDLSRIRTVIMRNTLDSLSQSNVPRTAVNMNMADENTISALLDADIGGVIRVKGNVNDAIQAFVTPDLSAQGLQMLEYMDQRSEEASGVTRHAQGLNPEAITDTKGGIEALQGAANERIELIARWLAKGLTEVFENILHLVAAHQDKPRTVKINGKPLEIDPRTWSDEMAVEVSIGMATENRQTRIMNLNVIEQKQAQIIATVGADNPICGIQEYRTTLAMLSEAMGFRSAQRFFKEIPEDYKAPPPGPDPKIAMEQEKLKLEQQKAQQQAQLEQAKAEANAKLQNDKQQFEMQLQHVKAQTDKEVAVIKVQSEQQIAEMRINAETMIAAERARAEMQLARWRTKQETKIKGHQARAMASQKMNGDGVRMGGAIG